MKLREDNISASMVFCIPKYNSTDAMVALAKDNIHVTKDTVFCGTYSDKPTLAIEVSDDNAIKGNLKYFK
jgi:hypothetical protein